MTRAVDRTYDELLSEVPPNARPAVARAKNNRVRAKLAYAAMLDASNASKADVRELHFRWGLNPYQISRLLDLSRNRVKDFISDGTR